MHCTRGPSRCTDSGSKTLASLDPQLADELQRMRAGNMPEQWQAELPSFDPDAKGVASRAAGARC